MPRCVALLDGGPGTYGIALTGLPGCTSMGCDENEAYQYAVAALDEWFEYAQVEGLVASPRSLEVLRPDPSVTAAAG